MSDKGFGIIREIGAIELSKESEVRFSIDEFRGRRYGSIRRFVRREDYCGPTHAGITLNTAILEGLHSVLSELPKEPEALGDRELGRFAKRPGLTVVARITVYRDSTDIDIREWQGDSSYTGWTKRGIRIPYNHAEKTADFLEEMRKMLAS
ncbi:MAG: hypothetical protein ABIG11_05600 [bacterium]